jgi:hypothetical protein
VPKYHPEPVLWTQLKPVSTNVMQGYYVYILMTFTNYTTIIYACSFQRKTFPCHMWLELPIHMRRLWTLHVALNLPYYELNTHDSVSRRSNILPLKCTKLIGIMLQQVSHASYTAPEITPSNVLNGNCSSVERDQLFSLNVHLTKFILFDICLLSWPVDDNCWFIMTLCQILFGVRLFRL